MSKQDDINSRIASNAAKDNTNTTEDNVNVDADTNTGVDVGADTNTGNWLVGNQYPSDLKNENVIAVRMSGGINGTYWRGGVKFSGEWRFLRRDEVNKDRNWLRIATDPFLEVRAVEKSKRVGTVV